MSSQTSESNRVRLLRKGTALYLTRSTCAQYNVTMAQASRRSTMDTETSCEFGAVPRSNYSAVHRGGACTLFSPSFRNKGEMCKDVAGLILSSPRSNDGSLCLGKSGSFPPICWGIQGAPTRGTGTAPALPATP